MEPNSEDVSWSPRTGGPGLPYRSGSCCWRLRLQQARGSTTARHPISTQTAPNSQYKLSQAIYHHPTLILSRVYSQRSPVMWFAGGQVPSHQQAVPFFVFSNQQGWDRTYKWCHGDERCPAMNTADSASLRLQSNIQKETGTRPACRMLKLTTPARSCSPTGRHVNTTVTWRKRMAWKPSN